MAGRVLREQIPNKAIILGSYFQTVNPIHQVECAPLFSCKCAYFKQGRTRAAAPQKTKWPNSNVTSPAKPSSSPRQSKFPSFSLPHPFVHLPPMALPRCILFVFMSVFTTKPYHPWLILKPAWLSGGRRMLCCKTTGFKSWLETRKHMTLNMWLKHFVLQCSELKTGIKNTIPYSCCDDHQVNLQMWSLLNAWHTQELGQC